MMCLSMTFVDLGMRPMIIDLCSIAMLMVQ